MRIWGKDRFRSEEAGNFTRVRHHLVYGQQRRVGIRCQSITVRVGCITEREDEKKIKDGLQTGAQLNSVNITSITN